MKIDQNKVEQLKKAPFKVNGVEVDYHRNLISINDTDNTVQPMVIELLVLLASHKGRTLSKDEIVNYLWPNTVVGPDSLANTMARLRKILGDEAKSPTYIETVQRKGYRWLQSIEDIKKKTSRNRNTTITTAAIILLVILVSLFTIDLFEEPAEEFLFPEFSITKLPNGGYEIEAAIDGELTEEKKAAMLKEIKRITGEEHSGMEFTFDSLTPICVDKEGKNKNCDDKTKSM